MYDKYLALIENCFNVEIDEDSAPIARLYDDGRIAFDGAYIYEAVITENKPVFARKCDSGTYTHIFYANAAKAHALFKKLIPCMKKIQFSFTGTSGCHEFLNLLMNQGAHVCYGSAAIKPVNDAQTLWEFEIAEKDHALAAKVYAEHFAKDVGIILAALEKQSS